MDTSDMSNGNVLTNPFMPPAQDDSAELTDDEIQKLMDAGVDPERIQMLKDQAKRLRTEGDNAINGLGGRYVGAGGRIFVANSPIEVGAAAFKNYRANQMANAADQQQQGLLGNIAGARGTYAQRIAARLRQKAAMAPQSETAYPEPD